MTHRVAQSVLFFLLIGGWFLITAPLAAQDSTQPAPTKSSPTKSKKTASPATANESAKEEDSAAKTGDTDKAQPAKADETKTDEAKKDDVKTDEAKKDEEVKKEEAPPPGPKLIEIPQDDATYTPRPKTVAVFVFTNGNRIESDDYLITKDALFINKDGQKTRYPINTVDRAATKAANQSRGVDIVFPKSKSEFNLDF